MFPLPPLPDEQIFSILQRKCLRFTDLADRDALSHRVQAYVTKRNTAVHPFK